MSGILRNQEVAAIDKLSLSIMEGINTTFIYNAIKGNLSETYVQETLNRGWKERGNFFNFYNSTSKAAQENFLKTLGISSAYDTIGLYISFCQSCSPIVLKDISAAAWKTVEEYGIDEFGDDKSWSVFWMNTSQEGKNDFLDYIHQLYKERKESEELIF